MWSPQEASSRLSPFLQAPGPKAALLFPLAVPSHTLHCCLTLRTLTPWCTPNKATELFLLSMLLSVLLEQLCCCSVTQLCLTLCDPTTAARQTSLSLTISQNFSGPCPLQRWCNPAVSSSDALFSFCPQSFQHQGLFQWDGCSHQVTKLLQLLLQHQSLQWIFRTDFL